MGAGRFVFLHAREGASPLCISPGLTCTLFRGRTRLRGWMRVPAAVRVRFDTDICTQTTTLKADGLTLAHTTNKRGNFYSSLDLNTTIL